MVDRRRIYVLLVPSVANSNLAGSELPIPDIPSDSMLVGEWVVVNRFASYRGEQNKIVGGLVVEQVSKMNCYSPEQRGMKID